MDGAPIGEPNQRLQLEIQSPNVGGLSGRKLTMDSRARNMVIDGKLVYCARTLSEKNARPSAGRCCQPRFYAMTYLPASITLCATCCCTEMTSTGSCFESRRRMAIWVRSMSPSATAAMTFLAAASRRAMAPAR